MTRHPVPAAACAGPPQALHRSARLLACGLPPGRV